MHSCISAAFMCDKIAFGTYICIIGICISFVIRNLWLFAYSPHLVCRALGSLLGAPLCVRANVVSAQWQHWPEHRLLIFIDLNAIKWLAYWRNNNLWNIWLASEAIGCAGNTTFASAAMYYAREQRHPFARQSITVTLLACIPFQRKQLNWPVWRIEWPSGCKVFCCNICAVIRLISIARLSHLKWAERLLILSVDGSSSRQAGSISSIGKQ